VGKARVEKSSLSETECLELAGQITELSEKLGEIEPDKFTLANIRIVLRDMKCFSSIDMGVNCLNLSYNGKGIKMILKDFHRIRRINEAKNDAIASGPLRGYAGLEIRTEIEKKDGVI